MVLFWREIKTQAHPGNYWDSSEVKSWHLSSAVSLPSLATGELGIQMTDASEIHH